jgi:hypothetical protein
VVGALRSWFRKFFLQLYVATALRFYSRRRFDHVSVGFSSTVVLVVVVSATVVFTATTPRLFKLLGIVASNERFSNPCRNRFQNLADNRRGNLPPSRNLWKSAVGFGVFVCRVSFSPQLSIASR